MLLKKVRSESYQRSRLTKCELSLGVDIVMFSHPKTPWQNILCKHPNALISKQHYAADAPPLFFKAGNKPWVNNPLWSLISDSADLPITACDADCATVSFFTFFSSSREIMQLSNVIAGGVGGCLSCRWRCICWSCCLWWWFSSCCTNRCCADRCCSWPILLTCKSLAAIIMISSCWREDDKMLRIMGMVAALS